MSMTVQVGSVDVTSYFHLRLAATGLDATGLTIANVDMQYTRSGVAPSAKVDAVALAATDTAHTDNRGIEIDATDQPGLYRFDWPDAAFATGVREVMLTIKVATAFTETLRVELVAYNPADGVRLGLTALPNAAAEAAGGLYTRGTGAGQINQPANGMVDGNVVRWLGTAAATPTIAGVPEVDVTHWLGTAAATPTVAGVPEVDVTHFGGTGTTATGGRPEVNTSHAAGTAWGSGAITAASIAADAITAAKIADGAIDAGAFAADAITAAKVAADVGTEIGTAVWATTTRLLTAGTNIALAKGTGVTGFTDLSAAQVNTEVDTAIADARLDELLAADSDIDGAAPPTVGSVFHELLTKTTGSFTYDQTTDSLEAVRDNMGTAQTGDAFARLGAPAGASVSADIAAIEAQTDDIGAAGAGLTALASQTSVDDLPTNAELATALGTADDAVLAQVALVKAKTDNLPADPADASVVAGLIAAVETKVDTVDGVVDSILVDTAEIGAAGAGLTALASAANLATVAGFLDTEIAAILAAVDTEVAAIKAKTDNLPADPADASDVAAAVSAAQAAILSRLIALAITTGTVLTDGGNSETQVKTDLAETEVNHWKDAFLLISSGALAKQVKKITASTAGPDAILTVLGVGFSDIPADGVTFSIINR